MGNEESTLVAARAKAVGSMPYAPMSVQRTEAFAKGKVANGSAHAHAQEQSQPSLLLKTAYHGVWSLLYTSGLPPIPRVDHCFVYDGEKDRIVIAYGCDAEEKCFNDVWTLDVKTLKWTNLIRSALSQRSGCTATLVGRKMFVFGGICGGVYFGDLHSIDIDTGAVNTYGSKGSMPSPRIGAAVFSADNKSIVVWGGFDGRTQGLVHQFLFSSMEWVSHDNGFTGRASPAHCYFKGKHYIYGSSKTHGLLVYDPVSNSFSPVETKGCEPPTNLTRASLVAADEFIFLVGGESTANHMHIYALEVKRDWWFAFHVRPDGESLAVEDGIVNKIGLFMLPREFGASVIYHEATRALISVMGSRLISVVPTFQLAIGPALGLLHIRSDMLEIFASDGGFKPLRN